MLFTRVRNQLSIDQRFIGKSSFTTNTGEIIYPAGLPVRYINGMLQCKVDEQYIIYDMDSGRRLRIISGRIEQICKIGHCRYIFCDRSVIFCWDLSLYSTTRLNDRPYSLFLLCHSDGTMAIRNKDGHQIIDKDVTIRMYVHYFELIRGESLIGSYSFDTVGYAMASIDGHLLTFYAYDDDYTETIDLREIDSKRVKTLSILPDELQHHILLFLII